MSSMPQIQIRQQYAKIGIEKENGQWNIRQPRPDFEINTQIAELDVQYHPGELTIDQSAAREALGLGNVFQFTRRMAEEGQRLASEGTVRRVDEGNRMYHIESGEDVIAALAAESWFKDLKINYEGPFTPDPVEVQYRPVRPDVNFTAGSVDVHSTPNAPELEYIRGKLDIYLQQRNSIEITPPQIDMLV